RSTLTMLNGFESGGGLPPLGSPPRPDPAIQNQNGAGKRKGTSMYPLIHIKQAMLLFLAALGLIWFAFSTPVRAQVDGDLGNFNTAEGLVALGRNTGADNTATGAFALGGNTTGSDNTATGSTALQFNTTGNNNTATGAH